MLNRPGCRSVPLARPMSWACGEMASSGLWYTNGWYEVLPIESLTILAASIRLVTPNIRMAALIRASTVCGETPMMRAISLEL